MVDPSCMHNIITKQCNRGECTKVYTSILSISSIRLQHIIIVTIHLLNMHDLYEHYV